MERWKINLYTIWFAQILSLMSFGFGLPFLPFYIQELGVVEPDKLKIYIGILTAAPAITMGIMAPIWGMMADRWGKKLMLLRAMFFAAFVLAGMGLVTHVEHLVILRLAQGMFTGTVTASAVLVASGTPRNRMSFALGFLSSSTFIGFSVGPAIGGFIAEYVGYRVSFFVGAALMMAAFLLVVFFVNEEKIPMEIVEKETASKVALIAIFTPTIVSMLLVLLFMRVSRTVFNPYLPLFIQEIRSQIEGSAKITGIINSVVGLMTALSGITMGRLGDKYDKKKLLTIFLASGIVLSLPLVLINNLWGFTVVYSLMFLAVGGIEPIIMSVTSENTPAERRGMLFGVQSLVGSIGWAISPVLASIVSIRISIRSILLLVPAFLLFAIIAVLMAKQKKVAADEYVKDVTIDNSK